MVAGAFGLCLIGVAVLFTILKMLAKVDKSLEQYGDRIFAQEMAFRSMERAANLNEEAVKAMMAHFTLPPVAELPPPLPPADEPTMTGKKRKAKRG